MVRAVRKRRPGARKRRPLHLYYHRRRHRPITGIAVVLLVALGIVAGVMAATRDTGHSRAPVGADPGPTQTPAQPIRPGRAAAQLRRSEAQAVSTTLRYTPFIAAGSRRRRVIALSFDDGPSPYTAAIVRTLTRMRVPATFFVVGQQLRYFAAGVRDELTHGFTIGDHTENHAWLLRLGQAGQYSQIQQTAVKLERLGVPVPRLFRPPYGAYNRTTLATLRGLHMLLVLWSIDPGDWRRPGVKAIVANVLANSRPGAIVILHDGGGDRSETVAALPAIVNGLRRRGYQLVTVPRLLMLDPPQKHQRLPRLSGV